MIKFNIIVMSLCLTLKVTLTTFETRTGRIGSLSIFLLIVEGFSQVSQILFGYFFYNHKHLFMYICKHTFGDEYATWLQRHVPWEEGWDTGDGRSSSIQPNSRIAIENHQGGKLGWKNDSTNTYFYILANI